MVVEEADNSSLQVSRSNTNAGINFELFEVQASNPSEMVSENVGFTDSETGIIETSAPPQSKVAMVDGTPDISLGNYLSRPTLIDTRTWSTSDAVGNLGSTLFPWGAFLSNPVIRKKVDNFGYIRGKLKLKFLISGTPFQYGLLRTVYEPLAGLRTSTIQTGGLAESTLNVPYSQMPGLFLQPQASAGGTLELPFFYHENWLELDRLSLANDFGSLRFRIFAPLRVASTSGSTSLTVLTYAWMEEVELMAPTNSLAMQGDEYSGDGQISGPASAVAKVAGALSNVPVIGPYARATETVAGTVASIARFFGFCNPPVIEDVRGVMPLAGPMLASSQISTAVQKMTLDPKQELSLDPRLHGLDGTDELTIDHLTKKESLFATATWSTSDASGTSLLNMRVTPDMNTLTSFSGYNRAVHIPLSYLAHMFKNWRGDIVVRVKVVASKFHKGRLKLSFDPQSNISTIDPPANAVYTQIIDIGETDDVEINIPYHQATAWLDCDPSVLTNWNNSGNLAPRAGVDNGLFTVRVNTQLVAPTASPVTILFFIRAGDNFEFANPAQAIGLDQPYFFTFADVQGDKVDLEPKKLQFGLSAPSNDEGYGQNFGEKIVSLRDILHRSVLFDRTFVTVGTASPCVVRKTLKLMPYGPGSNVPSDFPTVANTISGTPATVPFAFCYMTHINWISAMFIGHRGGVNYTVTPAYGASTASLIGTFDRITDDNDVTGATLYGSVVNSSGSISARSALYRDTIESNGLAGTAIVATNTNNSLSVNLPDKKRFNFSLVNPRGNPYGSEVDGTYDQGGVLNIFTANTGTFMLQTHVGAGVDFTVLHFLCCPTVNYYNSFPLAP